MNDLISKIIDCENMCMKLYTHFVETYYGVLFYNEENRDSHDSNHVILYEDKIIDLESVLDDIKDFYLTKNLTPRIYQTCNGYFKKNEHIFNKCGFSFISYGTGVNDFSILNSECKINTNNRLKIRRLKAYDGRILTDIFGPDNAEFDALTIKHALNNENFHFIVGELNNEFISCASIYYHNGVGRIDHVATAPKHRKQGYSREIIKFIVNYHNKYFKDDVLFEWPANEVAKKIYYEAGFRYLFSKENFTAFYDSDK